MGGLVRDVRFALRMLVTRPVASGVIVLTLALGIGINATFFSGFYGMVLRPLPFEEPERLFAVDQARPHQGQANLGMSPGNFLDVRDAAVVGRGGRDAVERGVLAGLAAYQTDGFNLHSKVSPERVEGARTSADLFAVLGVRPAAGRAFTSEEEASGAAVVMISDALRQRQFDDRDPIGETLRLDDRAYEIIGVMPPGFAFPNWHDAWIPLDLDRATASYTVNSLQVIGRLRAGTSRAEAADLLGALAERQAESRPETGRRWTLTLRGLQESWMPPVTRTAAFVMQAMVTLVLLVVCANVANVVLAQVSARRQEMAVRTVMGADRLQLARLSLVESGLLALLGALLGLVPASFYDEWVRGLLAIQLPYWLSFEFEPPVFVFTAAITAATALALGLLPVLRRREGRLADALREGGRSDTGAGGGRLRAALVVSEYAMAVLILVAALLMVRSYAYLEQTDQGFAIEDITSFHVSLAGETYDRPARGLDFLERARRQLEGLSEVRSAAVVDRLPISRRGYRAVTVESEDRATEVGEALRVTRQAVSEEYFDTLGVPLRRGRTFTASEIDENRRVVVINTALAEALWPGADPLGRRLRVAGARDASEVIGVVGDVRPGEALAGIDQQPENQVYVPLTAATLDRLPVIVMQTSAPLAALAPRVRRELAAIDSSVAVVDLETMETTLREFYFAQHIWSRMFGLVALAALLIAAVGAYGVSAYSVTRRVREMGVRLALGAEPRELLTQVIRRGLSLAVVGLVIGLVAAFPVAGAMSRLLHGTAPHDPLVILGVVVLLLGVALVANFVPARRAARIDPVEALRAEG